MIQLLPKEIKRLQIEFEKTNPELVKTVGGYKDFNFGKYEEKKTKTWAQYYPPHPDQIRDVDYVVICSPNNFHYEQTQMVLKLGAKVICEKPLCLPWQPIIDDDRINVCLELRYIPNLPKKADIIRAVMVRDEAFFKSWKGDPKQAGGNLYEFFIHYVDLAILLNADFEGEVRSEGQQIREIYYNISTGRKKDEGTIKEQIECSQGYLDIMKLDIQSLYNTMYAEILAGRGIHPKDIMYLMWILNQNSAKYGYRYSGFGNKIKIGRELL